LKSQNIAPVVTNYQAKKEKFDQFQQHLAAGERIPQFQFTLDLRSPPMVHVDDAKLQALVFDAISVVGKPLNLVAVLSRVIRSLGAAIGGREQLIKRFQSIPIDAGDRRAQIFFGVPDFAGNRDENYPSTIEAIRTYTKLHKG
jgi:hypothetical protein